MPSSDSITKPEQVAHLIQVVRGQKVILDNDLASVYGVETKALNRAVQRNCGRFPADFIFRLTQHEFDTLRFQFGTSNTGAPTANTMRCQIGAASRRNIRYLPYAFTEHGAIMAATILDSPRAVQMSVFVVRAFVKIRSMLMAQKDFAKKLAELEKKLTERLDLHDRTISDIIQQIMLLLSPPAGTEAAA